jgi:AraC-like DNA-binding protein
MEPNGVERASPAVSLADAAARLGVSRSTVKRLIQGEAPQLWTYYVGRRRLTDEASLLRYKRQHSTCRG